MQKFLDKKWTKKKMKEQIKINLWLETKTRQENTIGDYSNFIDKNKT